jgi:HEPN domain-containing protein
MPPLQRFEPDDPREWLNRARSNLARAHRDRGFEGIYLEDMCFDAQQVAEKSIKAVLLHLGIRFPWTHDIAELLTLVGKAGVTVPDDVAEATDLTLYAVAGRYPGHGEPVTEEECDADRRVSRLATGHRSAAPRAPIA